MLLLHSGAGKLMLGYLKKDVNLQFLYFNLDFFF